MAKKGQRASRRVNSGVIGRARWAEVARLRASGERIATIATMLKVDPSAISRTINLPEVVDMIAGIHRELIKAAVLSLSSAVPQAVLTMQELAETADKDSTRLSAAAHILDRTGLIKHAVLAGETETPDAPKLSQSEVLEKIKNNIPPEHLAGVLRELGYTVEREDEPQGEQEEV